MIQWRAVLPNIRISFVLGHFRAQTGDKSRCEKVGMVWGWLRIEFGPAEARAVWASTAGQMRLRRKMSACAGLTRSLGHSPFHHRDSSSSFQKDVEED